MIVTPPLPQSSGTLRNFSRSTQRWRFIAVFVIAPILPHPVFPEDVELRLNSFPPDTEVSLVSPGNGRYRRVLEAEGREDRWRVFPAVPDTAVIELRAPGYAPRRIHLAAATVRDEVVSIEERLIPEGGPLSLVAEAPSGASPKSVAFIGHDRLVVPLLRGDGADLYRIVEDRWGGVTLERTGRLDPPPEFVAETGFVEPLVLPRTGEIWVSQMNAATVHRFDGTDGNHLGSYPSGGGWPKVLAPDPEERTIWVANWSGENVVRIDRRSGRILDSIDLDGQPRGIAVRDEGRTLWVCIFSSGEVVRVDTVAGRVTYRIGPDVGAARHIVPSPRSRMLYFSDMYHGTVNVLDPVERTVIASRQVGINVNTIAFDPEGRFLFVSERGRNNRENYLLPGPEFGRIIVLDPETLEPIQEIYGRHQPTGLAVSPDGRYLAATDFLDDNVALYRLNRE
ncbi:MAG: beta-propeller fold lactonase family protein [Alkalispirochaeta sp.]